MEDCDDIDVDESDGAGLRDCIVKFRELDDADDVDDDIEEADDDGGMCVALYVSLE